MFQKVIYKFQKVVIFIKITFKNLYFLEFIFDKNVSKSIYYFSTSI